MDVTDIDLRSVDHVLTTTRAVRRRLDLGRPVERELIESCIDIATQAPTALHGETWHFVVITDPSQRVAVAEIYRRAAEGHRSGVLPLDSYLIEFTGGKAGRLPICRPAADVQLRYPSRQTHARCPSSHPGVCRRSGRERGSGRPRVSLRIHLSRSLVFDVGISRSRYRLCNDDSTLATPQSRFRLLLGHFRPSTRTLNEKAHGAEFVGCLPKLARAAPRLCPKRTSSK
jgi:Nitroreductase family